MQDKSESQAHLSSGCVGGHGQPGRTDRFSWLFEKRRSHCHLYQCSRSLHRTRGEVVAGFSQ
jgi:hypothetical protein